MVENSKFITICTLSDQEICGTAWFNGSYLKFYAQGQGFDSLFLQSFLDDNFYTVKLKIKPLFNVFESNYSIKRDNSLKSCESIFQHYPLGIAQQID